MALTDFFGCFPQFMQLSQNTPRDLSYLRKSGVLAKIRTWRRWVRNASCPPPQVLTYFAKFANKKCIHCSAAAGLWRVPLQRFPPSVFSNVCKCIRLRLIFRSLVLLLSCLLLHSGFHSRDEHRVSRSHPRHLPPFLPHVRCICTFLARGCHFVSAI